LEDSAPARVTRGASGLLDKKQRINSNSRSSWVVNVELSLLHVREQELLGELTTW